MRQIMSRSSTDSYILFQSRVWACEPDVEAMYEQRYRYAWSREITFAFLLRERRSHSLDDLLFLARVELREWLNIPYRDPQSATILSGSEKSSGFGPCNP
jgi:hypothetical protein